MPPLSLTTMETTIVVSAINEIPAYRPGDRVRIADRSPIGHYRVPQYLRGKRALVQKVIEPSYIDNEEEGFGRNAGGRRHYYRLSILMKEIWKDYRGNPQDRLLIEVFESWLERP